MNDTLAYLRGHRMWLVRDFLVWGTLSAYEFSFLITENDQTNRRILFVSTPLGGDHQKVNFSELVDFRGNNLPEIIENPKVAVFSKSSVGVVVVGQEDSDSFSIAKTKLVESHGLCDLLIFEVG